MTTTRYGFVGLGNMGAPMAANMAKAGFELMVYDKAGSAERAPAGTLAMDSLAQLAKSAQVIFLSVPDGQDSLQIAQDILALPERIVTTVIDLSTTGIDAAKAGRCFVST